MIKDAHPKLDTNMWHFLISDNLKQLSKIVDD